MNEHEHSQEAMRTVGYLANDVIQRMARKVPINANDRLQIELREVAVTHHIEVSVIHAHFLERLEEDLDPADTDLLKRSSLQFLITQPAAAE
jgi:hypothetical protein